MCRIIRIEITAFKSGDAFLDSFKPFAYEIVFLDIYMPGINGVDVKPIEYKKLCTVLDKCHDRFADAMRFIEVLSDRVMVKILLCDILYVEVFDKTCIFHTRTKNIKTYNTLSEIEQLLGGLPFLRCHRTHIVNMTYIVEVLGVEFMLRNGEGGKLMFDAFVKVLGMLLSLLPYAALCYIPFRGNLRVSTQKLFFIFALFLSVQIGTTFLYMSFFSNHLDLWQAYIFVLLAFSFVIWRLTVRMKFCKLFYVFLMVATYACCVTGVSNYLEVKLYPTTFEILYSTPCVALNALSLVITMPLFARFLHKSVRPICRYIRMEVYMADSNCVFSSSIHLYGNV